MYVYVYVFVLAIHLYVNRFDFVGSEGTEIIRNPSDIMADVDVQKVLTALSKYTYTYTYTYYTSLDIYETFWLNVEFSSYTYTFA